MKNRRIKTMLFSLTIMGTLWLGSTIAFAQTTSIPVNLKYTSTNNSLNQLVPNKLINLTSTNISSLSPAIIKSRELSSIPVPQVNLTNRNIAVAQEQVLQVTEKTQLSDSIIKTQQDIQALSIANQAPEALLKLYK